MIEKTKIKNLLDKKSIQMIIVLLVGIFLGCYYLSNVGNIYTLWEIPDEAGYLFNASLFSNYDWREAFSNSNEYYGFGYSMLLVPLFYFCETGLDLIRASIVVNIIGILFLYLIQIYLMSKIFFKCQYSVLALISGAVCLYPYLVCSSMKVICEVFLTLWVWVICFFLYKSFLTQKYRYFCLLGATTVYIYFIHIRSIAVIASVGLILLIGLYSKKNALKKVLCFFVPFVGCFLLLNIFKKEITAILGTGIIVDNTEANKNLITGNFLWDRIKWLFSPENLKIYALCAVGKIFYLISSTGGVILVGFFEFLRCVRDCLRQGIKEIKPHQMSVLFMGSCFLIMFLLSCISGTGDTYASFIYGRYYEYTIGFLMFFGIYSLIYKNYKYKTAIVFLIISLGTGCVATELKNFNAIESYVIDTSRYSGFSYAISSTDNFISVFLFSALLVGILLAIYFMVKKSLVKTFIIPLVVIVWFLSVDKFCLKAINDTNAKCKTDIEMTEYIAKNEKEQIYFVYEPYKYNTYFERMQVFLKNKSMHIILPEDLKNVEDNSWIVTYINSEKANELKTEGGAKYIMDSAHYELFGK